MCNLWHRYFQSDILYLSLMLFIHSKAMIFVAGSLFSAPVAGGPLVFGLGIDMQFCVSFSVWQPSS